MSFQKAAKKLSPISGSKIQNSQYYVSSGIPSLDHIIGGGIPVGTICLVEEDVLSNYSRVMNKFFIAEGIVCKHAIATASLDVNTKDMISELPSPVNIDNDQEETVTMNNDEKMKIAWRYEDVAPVNSTFGTSSNFGHNFDLSKPMDKQVITQADIKSWSGEDPGGSNKRSDFNYTLYYDLLKFINDTIEQGKFKSSDESSNILRISIHSLGSPLWTSAELDSSTYSTDVNRDLIKFIFCLRALIRNSNAVVFVTIPSYLLEDENTVKRILHSVDVGVKLESFAGSDRETNPVFKDYHGLFHITKLSAINTLVPYLPPSADLAFKLRRKKFIIEKLHLPPGYLMNQHNVKHAILAGTNTVLTTYTFFVHNQLSNDYPNSKHATQINNNNVELQESSEREQDDITTGCGKLTKKNLDF